LAIRNADPGIPFIPRPRPLIPEPIIPAPFVPRPRPGPGSLGTSPRVTCKRAVGEACPNIPAFNDEFVDGYKEKGLIRQQALIEKQRAQTLKDVDDPKRDVAGRYDIRVEDDDVDIALDADERRWLESDDLNIPGFQER
jgi:hypothetical protein